MNELKPLKPEFAARALEKAERYRLLNEPAESESICLDVLAVDPANRRALVWLLLSLTDQIAMNRPTAAEEARKLLPRLASDYERSYYAGVIAEREGKARLRSGAAGSGFVAYDLLRRAMRLYEQAQALAEPDNDDAVLRYNSCVRMIAANPELRPEPAEDDEPAMLE